MKKIGLLLCVLLAAETRAGDDPFAFDLTAAENSEEASAAVKTRFSKSLEGRLGKYFRKSGFLSSRLRLNSSLLMDAGYASLYVSGMLDYDEAVRHYDKRSRASLYEFYGKLNGSSYGLSGFQISAGKMRVSWGVSDGRSTIDVINASYFRDPMVNGRTVLKWPSWVIRAEQATFAGNVEGVFLPFGKDRKMPKYDSPWESDSIHALREADRKGVISFREHPNPRKAEWGVRYIKYMTGADAGISYYSGFTDYPALRKEGSRTVLMEPVRSRTVSINGAMARGSSTLRAETAFTAHFPVYDESGDLRYSDVAQVIAGCDRNLDGGIYLNGQLFYDRYSSYRDDYGLTFALSQKYFNDSLNVGINALYGRENEHSVEVFAEYAVSDSLSMNIRGYWIGGGPAYGMYRSYDRNDYAELGFKYYL